MILLLAAFFQFVPVKAVKGDDPVLTKDSLQRRIAEQVLLYPQEKLYVHPDKPRYVTGERLWFRAYLVDAVLHVPSQRDTYVQVELISPGDSVVGRVRVHRVEGSFSGQFDLPATLSGGDYVLRAYTDVYQAQQEVSRPGNYGSNTVFHRKVQLLSPLSQKQGLGDGAEIKNAAGETQAMASRRNTYSVSFYPEGGYLVDGLPNRVAFKALHPDGSPAWVRGRLLDHEGRDYGVVETLHAGMGRFEVTPERGRRYFVVAEDISISGIPGDDKPAVLGSGKEFPLPSVEPGAYALKVRHQEGELEVSVLRRRGADRQGPLYLLLHTRGMVHYLEAWDDDYEGIAFETVDFPSGVVQVLLLDADANPLSERLVFCKNDDHARLTISPDKTNYGKRSKVKSAIRLTDPQGSPLSGSFSVSVTDDYDVSPDSAQDILATMLLGSELRGHIPDPSFYLREGNDELLDLLLMTHGWRRYNIPEVLRQQYAVVPAPQQQGLAIRGVVTTGRSGRPVAGTKVSVFSWQTDYADEMVTDSLGRFEFGGLEFADSLTFVVQTDVSRGLNSLTLHIGEESYPAVSGIAAAYQPNQRAKVSRTVQEEVQTANVIEKSMRHTSWKDMRAIAIEEVKIDAPKDASAGRSFSYYMPKDRRSILTLEQLEEIQPMSVSDALKHLPFVTVMEGEDGKRKAYIGQMKFYSLEAAMGLGLPAVVIVDDIILNEDSDIDNILDPFNIETIGILKGAGAVLLGGRSAGGAIVITTRKPMSPSRVQQYQQENIRTIRPLGLQEPVEFYAPVYETAAQRNQATADLRSTIYWNPDVKVLQTGQTGFEFYTADMDSTYTVVIEGVADNGLLIRQVANIEIK